jgi:GTP:adenosylcobinamide-phosphate guanylyltransferase
MMEKIDVWTAIILAGQRPGIDGLAAHFGEKYKALVAVAGEPMVTRVVRTLSACPSIARIVVLAQDPAVIASAVAQGGGAQIIASQAGISASILAVAGTEHARWPVFVTTADHPLLTPEMVEHFIANSQSGDLAVGMVERAVVLADYPENRRTWLKFSDGAWSGANLFALRTQKARAALSLWAEAEQDRKKAWKLFLHFGPWLALRAITRTVGLAHAFALAGKRLGLSAKLVALPYAEAAIDVDKVSDHGLAEAILKARLS